MRLREADAVAHVKARREILAQHQRGFVGEVRLHAHIFDPHARAELLRENGAALRQQLVAGLPGVAVLG